LAFIASAIVAAFVLLGAGPVTKPRNAAEVPGRTSARANMPVGIDDDQPTRRTSSTDARSEPPASPAAPNPFAGPLFDTIKPVIPLALATLAPVALLMFTSFVRINIVLMLLRQALGSPQVPGNQVLMALALLLTALVMRPEAEAVYTRAIEPYNAHRITEAEAWEAGHRPIKDYMVRQIENTNHQEYLWQLYDLDSTLSSHRAKPTYADEFPLRVVAPAYLLSELTTALVMGFYLYLPFLVIDLVVSSVLAAMGLFMLPPSLVALPLKLILFVMADGWLLVATMLVRSFAT
jgi:flagellar biosynthetic protein FliP